MTKKEIKDMQKRMAKNFKERPVYEIPTHIGLACKTCQEEKALKQRIESLIKEYKSQFFKRDEHQFGLVSKIIGDLRGLLEVK